MTTDEARDRRTGWARRAAFGVLGLYSFALTAGEWRTSQATMRPYFSDIEGAVRFYGVNTTLTVALLWAAALLFAVSAAVTDARERRLRLFYLSQVAVFGWLGFDDRFQFHEWAAGRLGIGDHFVLLATGVAQLLCLAVLAPRGILATRAARSLWFGAAAAGVMLAIDALGALDGFMRLSAEDLAKTWAAAWFACFAWDSCLQQIARTSAATRSQAGT